MRRIKSIVPTVDQLHLPRTLNDIVMQNRGLILITGATGSGKTSTLAAMLDYRNANSSGHILTIEDPIEFVLSDKNCIVSQREVDVDTLNWDNALKGAMRQAPDVILIGEMRDLRSAKVSMDLAETGHLVLSTLHASNTMQTLERFISIFPREMHEELYLRLSMSLVAIVCQRLVKTKDGAERYPALEIMISTPRIKDLIRKGEINAIKEVVASSRNMGMVTFDQSIFDLWKQGIISEEEALNNADSPNNLQLMMKGISYAETE
jgi:twitching motility protein PilU